MRPADQKRTNKANAQGRVRTFIKSDLWWLTGFPVPDGGEGVQWMALPDGLGRPVPETVRLDREQLRRAGTRSLWLLENFPRALPAIVGNTAEWIAGVERVLEMLKPAVHLGATLPARAFNHGAYTPADLRAAERLRTDHPELSVVLDALSWRSLRQPRRLTASLGWVERHVAELSVLAGRRPAVAPPEEHIAFLLGLLQLVESDGEKKVSPILSILGDRRLYDVPLQGFDLLVRMLNKALTMRDFAPVELWRGPAAPDLPQALLSWARWAMAADARTRQRSVRLLVETRLYDLWDESEAWWESAEVLTRGVKRLWRQPVEKRKAVEKQLRAQVHKLAAEMPATTNGQSLTDALQRLAQPEAASLFLPTLEALAGIPAAGTRAPVRSQFVCDWGGRLRDAEPPDLAFEAVLRREFARYLQHTQVPLQIALEPWRRVSDRMDESLRALGRRGELATFFDALVHHNRTATAGIRAEVASTLACIVELTHDARRAADLLAHLLREFSTGFPRRNRLLPAALELTLDAPGEFGQVVRMLEEKELYDDCEPLCAMGRALNESGIGSAPLRAMMEDQWQEVRWLALGLQVLQQQGAAATPPPPCCIPAHPEWIDAAPHALHPVLEQLAGVHPEAETIAMRILSKALQDAGSREREVDLLRARLADGTALHPDRVQRRIEALSVADGDRPGPSAALLARLERRLRRAWAAAILRAWSTTVRAGIENVWQQLGTTGSPPEWLLEPHVLELIRGFSSLAPVPRKLAWEILLRRADLPPWDWRDADANRLFIERMTGRGIDMAPWVDGVGVMAFAAPPGRVVRLALEDDPLEVLAMGAPFKTCLSPGNFNFFAAVTNAVDINKRVLFVRDMHGKVIGRCLLALTEEGKILVFHAYCHDPGLGFASMAADIAALLAERMRTSIVANGHVETLVANSWYHDEPTDITGMYACLTDGSPLRIALQTMDPKDLLGALDEAFATAQLDAATLALVLRLPEITARPALAEALVPRLERERIDPSTREFATELFQKSGRLDLALRMFGEDGVEVWLAGEERGTILYEAAWRVLLASDPAGVLRALRRLQARGDAVGEDGDSTQRYFAARAHDLLHRPGRALRLYRQLEAGWGTRDQKAYAKQRGDEIAVWLASRKAKSSAVPQE